jgi:hypothetical protein
MKILLFLFLVLGRLPWNYNWSQHWKSVEELCSYFLLFYFVLSLVLGRSQVIDMRRSYCDEFSHSCFHYCSYHKNVFLVFYFPLLFLLL